jgi:hypothetical protein
VCGDGAGNLGYIQDSLFAFFYKEVTEDFPDLLGTVGCWGKKGVIPFIRFVILLDKVANVDFLLPEP